jgi:hypothetical protein
MLCSPVKAHWCLEGPYYLHLWGWRVIKYAQLAACYLFLYAEDGGMKFLQNTGEILPDYTA